VVDPTYEKCNPSDTACVARNAAVGATFGSSQLNEWLAARLASCIALGSDPVGCHAEFDPGGSYAATANAGQPVQGYVAPIKVQTMSPTGPSSNLALVTGVVAPPSISLVNITQGKDFTNGGVFDVGDAWEISIMNTGINLPITANSTINGTSTGPSNMGNTGPSGIFVLRGVMDNSTVGNWVENWSVPSGKYSDWIPISAALNTTIRFSVRAKTAVTQSSQTTPQASGTQTGNSTNTTQNTGGGGSGTSTASSQTVFGLFGDTSPVLFGVVNEYTALGIAAALVVGFMMVKSGR
jgi:hypothetical protein